MFIKDLAKEYVNKKGQKCQALKGFSAELPDRGLVFILGKSGCGKSTLLNLIGCLDTPNDGDIIIGDKNIAKLCQQDREVFRANNVGFIFQNFNLFEQLNVYENIIINIANVNAETEDRINELLNMLDIAECKYKNINELSGGQQQRVSIVRALMKKCKILLADEPTGNLDESNSALIFETLKNVSANCLVLVVTHDTESAYHYGDYVIEMRDGVVDKTVVSNQNSYIHSGDIALDMQKSKKRMSLKSNMKLSVNFMIRKKLKMVLSVIMLAISLGIMGVTYMFYQYDFGAISASMLLDQPESYLSLARGFRDPDSDKYNMTDMMRPIEDEIINGLQNEFMLTGLDKNYQLSGMTISSVNSGNAYYRNYVSHAIVSKKDNLQKYGFYMRHGIYPIGGGEIALTDFLANSIALQAPQILMNRLQVMDFNELLTNDQALSTALGNLDEKTLIELFGENWDVSITEKSTLDYVRNNYGVLLLNHMVSFASNQYKISGIIGTDYLKTYSEVMSGESYDEVKQQELSIKSMHIFNSFFVSSEWIKDPYNGTYVTAGGVRTRPYSSAQVALPELNENEIYMSRNYFRKVFQTEFNAENIGQYVYNNSRSLTSVNGNYTCKIFEGDSLKIVGVYDTEETGYEIICRDDYFENYKKQILYCDGISFDLPNNSTMFTNMLNKIGDYDMAYNTVNAYFMYNLADILEIFKLVFLIISIVLGGFSAIMVYNYFSIIIQNQKKEIGIMRAIGVSQKQITSIYLTCSAILMSITTAIAWVILGVMGMACDRILVDQYIWYTSAETLGNLKILTFSVVPFLIIGVFGMLISVISTLLPIYKINKMKAIDAIRNE